MTPPPPPPPMPNLLSPAVIVRHPPSAIRRPPSATRHPPAVILCQLSSQNLPQNQVDCRRRHRPLPLHCSPPHRLTRCIVRRPLSAQRYRHRRHCCNPLLTPTALVVLSALSASTAIVGVTPSLLQPLLSRLPLPALVAPSHLQCDNIAPAVVTVTS